MKVLLLYLSLIPHLVILIARLPRESWWSAVDFVVIDVDEWPTVRVIRVVSDRAEKAEKLLSGHTVNPLAAYNGISVQTGILLTACSPSIRFP